MRALPRITVVTPSYNQGRFLARTLDSVVAQRYPNLEHIVVDGMSTDESVEVVRRYAHLRLIREPDRGQADAINKGFRLATGDVHCFLNSDDLFLPGTLHRVAAEIDPARERHVVMGRCVYVDENEQPTGEEHPSAYVSHERVLEAWKVHCIPQPATFWSAEVWKQCGPLDVAEQLVPDYDLFCRMSRHYRFHFLDHVLAAYRLHPASKTCAHARRTVYQHALRVSRRYWGVPWQTTYWRLLGSFLRHRWSRAASRLTAEGGELLRRHHAMIGLGCTVAGAMLAPGTALRRIANRYRLPSSSAREEPWTEPEVDPETLRWRGYSGVYPDGAVGPTLRLPLLLRVGSRWLVLHGEPVLGKTTFPLTMVLAIDGQVVEECRFAGQASFALRVRVDHLRAGLHELEVQARPWIIPHDYLGNRDARPLTFRFRGLQLERDDRRAGGVSPLLSAAQTGGSRPPLA